MSDSKPAADWPKVHTDPKDIPHGEYNLIKASFLLVEDDAARRTLLDIALGKDGVFDLNDEYARMAILASQAYEAASDKTQKELDASYEALERAKAVSDEVEHDSSQVLGTVWVEEIPDGADE